MTKIILNGKEVEVDPKEPLIHACHMQDIDVPMYCYHPGLTPVGSCRICQVEVQVGKMPPRVVVACRTPVSEGMVVNTEAAGAHDARRECLEFLLKNHPLDCPICDKAGECDLQDYAFEEGQGEGRTVEPRRQLEKRKSLGDVILLDQERCILCSRCVRFFEDVTKKPQLTVAGLGSRSTIETFMDRPLEGNYQGNLADVCPVGALTLKKFRFKARVWNLSKGFSTCGECSRGCSVTVETLRQGEIKRMRPRYNPGVNDWWMCDTGRFSFHDLPADSTRLGAAMTHGERGLEQLDSEAALDEVADVLRVHPQPMMVLSPWLTQEEGALALELAQAIGAQCSMVSPAPTGLEDDLLNTGDPAPNRRGLGELGIPALEAEALRASLEHAEAVLLIGERVVDLMGRGELAAMDAKLRVLVLDLLPYDAPNACVSIGVPSYFERQGTWLNVDGKSGSLNVTRPMPAGVAPLDRTLGALLERCAEGASQR